MSVPGEALERALACHRVPASAVQAARLPLPDDMLVLLRLAAGDQALAADCAEASGEPAGRVTEAAVFYIQQAMFVPGADSYRVLGVNPDAADGRIKEHYRWLVRWLHPDRNTDGWDSIYADRVNRAWQDLRRPDVRQAYDTRLTQPADRGHTPVAPAGRPYTAEVAYINMSATPSTWPRPTAHIARRLPAIVLGTLALTAILALALTYYLQPAGGGRAPDAMNTVATASTAAAVPDAERWPRGANLSPPSAVGSQGPDAPNTVGPDVADSPAAAPNTVAAVSMVTAVNTAADAPDAERRSRRADLPQPPAGQGRAADAANTVGPDVADTAPAAMNTVVAVNTVADVADVERRPRRADPPPESVAVANTDTAADTAASVTLTEGEAHALVQHFSLAYAAGDITALMRLFTRDASNNRGNRDAIAYDYQSLFSTSTQREIQIQPTGWIQREDGATVLARYTSRVRATGARRVHTRQGDIRFDLRLESGSPRISRLRHDDNEG